jgi:hypothetical protein
MYSQTEQYTAMVVNIQCKYMSCFACKNQTSKLDKENIEWAIKKEQSRETGNIWYSSIHFKLQSFMEGLLNIIEI